MKIISGFLKIILGLLLLPFLIGAAVALYQVILASGHAQAIWLATVSGAIFWVLIYIFLPEPSWLYVFGHELTHAIWSACFGGKLKKIKVRSDGGHVVITESNFLITLAPYFFPLYVIVVVIIFTIGNFFWQWSQYQQLFYFLIGFFYAFHITLTTKILKIKQPDIIGEGYFFSTVIILLGNLLILLIGIPLLTGKTSVASSLHLWLDKSFKVYTYLSKFIQVRK